MWRCGWVAAADVYLADDDNKNAVLFYMRAADIFENQNGMELYVVQRKRKKERRRERGRVCVWRRWVDLHTQFVICYVFEELFSSLPSPLSASPKTDNSMKI